MATAKPTAVVRLDKRIRVSTVYYPPRREQSASRAIPYIRLRGQWLQQAGFDPDSRARITVMDGCLIMTAEPVLQPTGSKKPR